jgi:hypothetical protein
MRLDLFTGENQMDAASSFRFAAWKKHVHTRGVAKLETLPFRHSLNPLQIRALDHDVNILGIADGGGVHLVHLDHYRHPSNNFVGDLFSGKRSGNPFQCTHEGKEAFFKQGVNAPAFLCRGV